MNCFVIVVVAARRRSLAQFLKDSKIDYNNKTVGSHC